MKSSVVVLVLGLLTAVNCLDLHDGPEEDAYSADETQLEGNTQLEEAEEEAILDDLDSVAERRACSASSLCEAAGGHCIRRGEYCNGAEYPVGYRRRSRRRCCVPAITPPTCPPSPTCPPATSSRIKDSVLEWNFVGEDHFVRFHERMTWEDGKDFCTIFGLELYQPKNITKVATYLADNFETYDQHRNYIGGRGNGTHTLWMSGEVVSSDEPWANDPARYPTYCLAIDVDPSRYSGANIEDDDFLWSTPCNHVSNLDYILCGDSHAYSLTWHTVGDDKFARYEHRMDWDDSRKLCQQFGFDLYQPKNPIEVSEYLTELSRATDNPLPKNQIYNWIGAKGNGTHIVWLSGEVFPNSSIWIFYWTYENRCVAMTMKNRDGEIIFPTSCSSRFAYPVCG